MRFSIEYSNPSACPTDIWAILMHFYIYTYLKLSQNYGVFNGLVWQAIFQVLKTWKTLVFIKAYNFLENIAFYKKSNFMSCPIFQWLKHHPLFPVIRAQYKHGNIVWAPPLQTSVYCFALFSAQLIRFMSELRAVLIGMVTL